MHIEREGDACIPEFIHTFLWLQAACHAYFEYIVAKRAYIADDIDRSGLPVLQIDDLRLFPLDGF